MCKKKKKKKEEATAATATADFARGPQFAGDASKSKVLLVALTSVARILVLLGRWTKKQNATAAAAAAAAATLVDREPVALKRIDCQRS